MTEPAAQEEQPWVKDRNREGLPVWRIRLDKKDSPTLAFVNDEAVADRIVADHNTLRDKTAAAEAAIEELAGVRQLIRDMDTLSQKEEDEDGFIKSYHFNTGAWHRLLGWVVAGAELPTYIRQQVMAAEAGAKWKALALEVAKWLKEPQQRQGFWSKDVWLADYDALVSEEGVSP